MTTDKERIIALEIKLDNIFDALSTHVEKEEEFQEKLQKCLNNVSKQLEEVNKDIIKYKGFVGGITLILSSIGIVLLFFKAWILTKLGLPT